jgi:hypothetical protein
MSEDEYRQNLRDFANDFVRNEVLLECAREDVRAIVVAGDVPAPRAFKLGTYVQEALGAHKVKILMDMKNPIAPIVGGAAERARDLGRPFRTGPCGPRQLTDEQYEEALKQWKAIELANKARRSRRSRRRSRRER